jgi:hypothetical protein
MFLSQCRSVGPTPAIVQKLGFLLHLLADIPDPFSCEALQFRQAALADHHRAV